MRRYAAALLLTAAACGPAKTRPEPTTAVGAGSGSAGAAGLDRQPVVPETVTADTPRATGRGIAFVIPAGWTIAQSGAVAILTAQDGDLRVAIVDTAAADPDAAVAEAWQAFDAGRKPPQKLANDAPGRDGWDAGRQYTYEVSPNEKRRVIAGALRAGTAWTAVILDGAEATIEKRGADLAKIMGSVRPSAYAKESFAQRPAHALDADRLAKLDELIERGRDALGIPGVSVAIVQDGKVIRAKGYGVRELGKQTPVDADTLYMIASNTKALSTLLLAELVDDGALRWDEKVTEAYPEFALGDAATTAAVEVRHLVCACTGLPRQDFEWIFQFKGATPTTEMRSLAGFQPTTKFGETFQYSNLLAAAAGFTAAHVLSPKLELGKAYDAAMQRRVFGPLGMRATTFDFKKALAANHASPHAWDVDGKPALAPMAVNYAIYPLRPAGGAWSSAADLIKYVQLELGNGVAPSGKRVVSEANLLERRRANVAVGEDTTYGMGLFVETEYGVTVVHHGGSMLGYKSDMLWLPDHGVGAVILTNADEGQYLLAAFKRYLLELLFDGKPEALENLATAATTLREATAAERTHLTIPADPAVAAELAPRYANDALGSLAIVKAGADVAIDVGEWQTQVASRTNDDGTTSLVTVTPAVAGIPFVVGKAADGKRTLTIRDAQHEYVFVEAAAAK